MSDVRLETRPSLADRNTLRRRLERTLHRSAYLGLQIARGRPVGPALHRLRRWDELTREAYAELARERLADMLELARARVPLYRTREWTATIDGGTGIERWPVLERQALVDRRSELMAEGFGALRVERKSSASTGTPVRIAWNPAALAWSWAAEYHPMLWHGLTIGARTLRMWGSGRRLENLTLNRHFVPAHDLSRARLDDALHYIETRRPELVWGSSSVVTELARHVGSLRGPAVKPLVPFVKVGGEQVYPFQREEIERYLGARVIESYGSTEVGPIAAECPRGSMHLLEANVHVEIFCGDVPARVGEFGDIVVTTLVNRAMPLVRCRIGDMGRLAPEACDCGLPQPVLSELRGRAADLLLRADGSVVHGSVLGDALRRYVGRAPLGQAHKVLFEQTGRRTWRVQVELPECEDTTELEAQVGELVGSTFGAECRVETKRVDRIPREASGKFRYYRASKELLAAQRETNRRTAALDRALFDLDALPSGAATLEEDELDESTLGSAGNDVVAGGSTARVTKAPPASAV